MNTPRKLLLLLPLLLSGCVSLTPPPGEEPRVYVLESAPAAPRTAPRSQPSLAVAVPRARAGYDTVRMAYLRTPLELEYFANSRWADTPARMLAPLAVQTLAASGAFASVVAAPNAAAADLRLDLEIVRLQQEFTALPSRARITLRAELIDVASRRVVAAVEIDEAEPAATENAYGGVAAANVAVGRALARLTEFAASARR